eukprot:358058-Chlamydomonas_euryale.AAC.1
MFGWRCQGGEEGSGEGGGLGHRNVLAAQAVKERKDGVVKGRIGGVVGWRCREEGGKGGGREASCEFATFRSPRQSKRGNRAS